MTVELDDERLERRTTMLVNRVRKTARHVRKWARREHVTCYRLYDRDIPEVPLAIDWYEGRLHVAEYKRMVHGEEVVGPDGWVDHVAAALATSLEVSAVDVFVKARQRQRGRAQYERLEQRGVRHEVGEGGHRFLVNLGDYLDTGLFLDHRLTRARVQAEAAGRRVLNLFCYTGSFTVYAARGGATSSLSVDLSNTYLDWARDNLALNGCDLGSHQLVRADVLEFLASPPHGTGRFGLAVLDPPTFSNSKAMRDILDVQRDHPHLIERTLALLAPGGVLYFSTNRKKFKLDTDALDGLDIEDLSAATIPEDFRNQRVHRCYRIVKR
jgi:23S rRNA G2069 N7-methylase RlmK/C1962 C5-methylase RlmI